MIRATRMNGDEFFINENLIEFIEETSNTVVTLESGKTIKVKESAETLLERIIEFEARVRDFREGGSSDGFVS